MSQEFLSLKFFEAHCAIFPTKERCPIKIQRIGKISTDRWEERDSRSLLYLTASRF